MSDTQTANKLAHDEGAINNLTEIEKSDIKWIESFNKTVLRKKDPISLYEGKADRYVKGQKIGGIVKIVAIVILAVLALLALKHFKII